VGAVEKEGNSPFSTLFSQVGDQFANVKDSFKRKDEAVATTTASDIILSEEEVATAKEALEQNASSSDWANNTVENNLVAIPVMIGTTSATGTVTSATSTE
jgi:hypothetical protein